MAGGKKIYTESEMQKRIEEAVEEATVEQRNALTQQQQQHTAAFATMAANQTAALAQLGMRVDQLGQLAVAPQAVAPGAAAPTAAAVGGAAQRVTAAERKRARERELELNAKRVAKVLLENSGLLQCNTAYARACTVEAPDNMDDVAFNAAALAAQPFVLENARDMRNNSALVFRRVYAAKCGALVATRAMPAGTVLPAANDGDIEKVVYAKLPPALFAPNGGHFVADATHRARRDEAIQQAYPLATVSEQAWGRVVLDRLHNGRMTPVEDAADIEAEMVAAVTAITERDVAVVTAAANQPPPAALTFVRTA